MKKTPWFNGSVKPVRIGYYEREFPWAETIPSKWDGQCWAKANLPGHVPSMFQDLPWRGLAADPSIKGVKS